MGIVDGVAQRRRQVVRLRGRQEVFAGLRLPVPLFGGRSGAVGQEPLPQAVRAHDVQRLGSAGLGEPEACGPCGDEPLLLQLLEEADGLGARDLDAAGHALGRRGQPVVLELVELLEHVFHANPFGEARNPAHPDGDAAGGPEDDRAEHRKREEDQECEGGVRHGFAGLLGVGCG